MSASPFVTRLGLVRAPPAANERTFLNWCSMAVTMGAAASAMLSFNRSNAPAATRTADIVTVVFTPISIALVLYALFTFYKRSRFMQHKQLGHYDDRLGPMVLASIIFVSLLTLLLKGLRDFATGTTAPPALRAWLGIAEQ